MTISSRPSSTAPTPPATGDQTPIDPAPEPDTKAGTPRRLWTTTLAAQVSTWPLRTLRGVWRWSSARRVDLCLIAALLAVNGMANAWNLHGWPGRINDDEGTYVNQAWAMLTTGHIAHYTYWYDHPFLGWALIAGYAWLTHGFAHAPSAVMVGREFMLINTLVATVLIYALARRLNYRRPAGTAATLLFGLSPLAIYFHRMVFLDNLSITWVLAALLALASPRRGRTAALTGAVCFAAAVLCKETTALLLPALLWLLVQHTDRRHRTWNLAIFLAAVAILVSTYPLFALFRNELLSRPGHVSLAWALWWQLIGRAGSGSPFDTSSVAYQYVRFWIQIDPWLLIAGLVLTPLALAVRRLRPLGIALLVLVGTTLRGGYLPFPYVIGLLPFCALVIAGVADVLVGTRAPTTARPTGVAHIRRAGWVPVGAVLAFTVMIAPAWWGQLRRQATLDGSRDSRAATAWVAQHVPKNAVVVTDDYIWLDLRRDGFAKTTWLWKVDTDPVVHRELLPDGYRDIQYIVLPDQPPSTLNALPTLKQALAHANPVAVFGSITVRKVQVTPPA